MTLVIPLSLSSIKFSPFAFKNTVKKYVESIPMCVHTSGVGNFDMKVYINFIIRL